MIETIRLIRKKKDDIWALYIIEFLKFIGCIVNDYVFPDTPKLGGTLTSVYDANIVLNFTEEEIKEQYTELLELTKRSEEKIVFIPEFDFPDSQNILKNNGSSSLLGKIISEIWGAQDQNVDNLKYLNWAYTSSNIFFFLYNEGNLQHIQEYYSPSSPKDSLDSEDRLEVWRKEAYEISFRHFAACYNKLMRLKLQGDKLSVYYKYALLLMKYKLNEMVQLLENNIVFVLDSLLEQVEEIQKQEPDFVRINYLAGSICRGNTKYWWKAEEYYQRVIEIMRSKKKAEDSICFLHYQMGRFYEKKLKQYDTAVGCYEKAYECNKKSYRVLYKLAKREERCGNHEKVVAYANEMIKILLNGYGIAEIMPKEQIYAYKSFMLMGDTYFKNKNYDLAIRCYDNAERVAKASSRFYEILYDEEIVCFEKIYRNCMPLQPVYFKIISCASKGNDIALSNAYFSKLQSDMIGGITNEGDSGTVESE